MAHTRGASQGFKRSVSMDKTEFKLVLGKGETQTIEFKSRFPANARDLAKEVAAFASTDGGTVLLGVEDNANVVGLDGIRSDVERKALRERIEGLCAQSIVPPVQVSIEYVRFDDLQIVLIEVPSSVDEIHYVSGRPYIRSMSISRVATPQEVKEKILLADIGRRLRELESERGNQTAPAIYGQGELATMNRSDLFRLVDQRARRKIP